MPDNSKVEINGWGLMLPLLLVLFVGLKLTGYITWSWFWVLSPLWISLVAWLLLTLVALVVVWYAEKKL